jgi:hypothetical protein
MGQLNNHTIGSELAQIDSRHNWLPQPALERAKAKGRHGRKVSATTIKKEIVTFTAAWAWATHQRIINRPFSKRGLRYPKTFEKPPFHTRQEIERKINRGGLTSAEEADLWDCLFLTLPEIIELLAFVRSNGRHPFIYPMTAKVKEDQSIVSRIKDVDQAIKAIRQDLIASLPKMHREGKVLIDDLRVEVTAMEEVAVGDLVAA